MQKNAMPGLPLNINTCSVFRKFLKIFNIYFNNKNLFYSFINYRDDSKFMFTVCMCALLYNDNNKKK